MFDKFRERFMEPHTCGGEDREDPMSWDDPDIIDGPYNVQIPLDDDPSEIT